MAEVKAIIFDCFGVLVDMTGKLNNDLIKFIEKDIKPKYRLAILSNTTPSVIERVLPKETRKLFDEIIVSGEVGYSKPDPEIFKYTLSLLQVVAHEAIFIDDTPEYVWAAKRLGVEAFTYVDLENLRKQLKP
jgi:putative hydrolase of the HAD superfamily